MENNKKDQENKIDKEKVKQLEEEKKKALKEKQIVKK